MRQVLLRFSLLSFLALYLSITIADAQILVLWESSYSGNETHRQFGASNSLGDAQTLDFDGDGVPDPWTTVTLNPGPSQRGLNELLSGTTGELIRHFDSGGIGPLPTPDLNDDSAPDLWTLWFEDGAARLGLYSGAAVVGGSESGDALLGFLAPPTSNPGFFGVYKIVGPDATGDGLADLLVLHSGAVWLYSGGGVASGETTAVRAFAPPPADAADGAAFTPERGVQVVLTPDLDGDGRADVVVADPAFEPPGFSDVGVVYAFSSATGALLWRARADESDPETFTDAYGLYGVVAIGGTEGPGAGDDLDGDGTPDLLVGSRDSDDSAAARGDVGGVYVHSGASGERLGRLRFAEPVWSPRFGTNLRAVPDADGDGIADFATAIQLNPAPFELGPWAVAIYSSVTGEELARVVDPEASSAGIPSGFGQHYLASPGDLDGDGRPDLFVSAPYADVDGRVDAGVVYAFAATPVSSEPSANVEAFRLSASPNPSRGGAWLSFRLPAAAGVRLTLHDALGREVARVADGARAAGPHRVALPAGLVPGVYLARLATGGAVATRTVSVVR